MPSNILDTIQSLELNVAVLKTGQENQTREIEEIKSTVDSIDSKMDQFLIDQACKMGEIKAIKKVAVVVSSVISGVAGAIGYFIG